MSRESENVLNIVKVGVCYQELDAFEKEALESFVSETRASEYLKQALGTTTDDLEESDETLYFPLNDAKDMRVLELDPGNPEDQVSCRLHVCSVDFEYPQRPRSRDVHIEYRHHTNHALSRTNRHRIWYTALSYVWGDPAVTKLITCNGKSLSITENLSLALRHVRRTDVAVMLWIDQICINQQDLQEKSQQVILMSRIYQRAWSTLVWLGEAAEDISNVVEMIRTVNEVFRYNLDESAPDPKDFERMSIPTPGSAPWSGLSSFLSLPWFQRVWIIQEIVWSLHVQVMYGQICIPWSDLSQFAICMVRHDLTQYLKSETGCIRIRMIDQLKSYNYNLVLQSSLLSVLVEGRGAQATDLRDKVFAVMGMASTTINPDYTKAVSDVYTEAATTILSDDPMSLLCCVDHDQPTIDCPSWVPCWSTPRQTTSLGYLKGFGMYQATKPLQIKPQIKDRGKSIILRGMIFDIISNIGPLAASCLEDVPRKTSPTSQFVAMSVQHATNDCQPCPYDSGLFDAFWQTLVAGKDASGFQHAPPEFAQIFALLIDSATGSTPSMPGQPQFKRRLTLDNLKVRSPSRIYRQMQVAFEAAVKGRRFGTTFKRYMGLLPRGADVGDQICVFIGGHIPFVVRPQERNGLYQLIGECYVHGIMNNQVTQMENLKTQSIELK